MIVISRVFDKCYFDYYIAADQIKPDDIANWLSKHYYFKMYIDSLKTNDVLNVVQVDRLIRAIMIDEIIYDVML